MQKNKKNQEGGQHFFTPLYVYIYIYIFINIFFLIIYLF